MKGTIGIALASGLALLVAGCATGSGGTTGGGGAAGGEAASSGGTATASASGVRDFNLQVKCPGIHLEKTKLNWPIDKIMSHENVTEDEINACERWVASQPKGYVPPPPPGAGGAAAAGNGGTGGQQAQSSNGGSASPH